MLAAPLSFDNDFARFTIEQQVLFVDYKPGIYIDVSAARQIVRDRLHFQGDLFYPILCDVRGLKGIDKSARDFLAKSGSHLAKAVALLADDKVPGVISQFYVSVSQPTVPTQLFYTRTDALDFLKTYL